MCAVSCACNGRDCTAAVDAADLALMFLSDFWTKLLKGLEFRFGLPPEANNAFLPNPTFQSGPAGAWRGVDFRVLG